MISVRRGKFVYLTIRVWIKASHDTPLLCKFLFLCIIVSKFNIERDGIIRRKQQKKIGSDLQTIRSLPAAQVSEHLKRGSVAPCLGSRWNSSYGPVSGIRREMVPGWLS